MQIHPLHICPHCRTVGKPSVLFLGCKEAASMNVIAQIQSSTSTHFHFLLVFLLFLTAVFNTIINKQVSYLIPNHYWSCQSKSRQTGSPAFRKYCSDKAPMTNWNCGKDSIPQTVFQCHALQAQDGHRLLAVLGENR